MDFKETKKDSEEIELVEEDSGEEARDKIKKLKGELAECQKKAEDYLAGWQRAKADFINSRKNEEKEKEAIVLFANQRMLYELLSVADSLERGLKESNEKEGGLYEGVSQTLNQLLQIMRGYGVNELEAESQKFNPEEHESVAEKIVEAPEADGIILEVLQKGYKLHDKILRPAKVKVGNYKIKS